MYDEHLKSCLIRLIQSLKDNKTYNRKNVTLFIGAGCSLSSSEKDVSTYGIIKDLVKKFTVDGHGISDSWTELYKEFTNNVWCNQGEVDRIHLLEQYFEDMVPSIGYHHIRYLLENGYINNIITTNFDPMLNDILDGLSYELQVGTKKIEIGKNPQFTLLKAHGDLKFGQLRFSPADLYKLPSAIEEPIHYMTEGIVIIVGYRGQDMGILQALNEAGDHCAYWISYDKPDILNEYENKAIFEWLKKRNSEQNLLYGMEYGDFDKIFTKIVDMLNAEPSVKECKYFIPWKKSFINDYMMLNTRFYKIFITMLKILEKHFINATWNSCSYYYAETHEKLATDTVRLLNEKIIPTEILYSIGNEVESLLFSISLEIWCLCQGYPVTYISLVELLQQQYIKNSENPVINDAFWDAVKWLVGNVEKRDELPYKSQYSEIIISFDQSHNFQTVLKKVSLLSYLKLLRIIQRLLLFTNTTCVNKTDLVCYSSKKTLEEHLYIILAHNSDIDIKLNAMDDHTYKEIYENLLHFFFAEQIAGDRRILFYENIFVQVQIEKKYEPFAVGILDEISESANMLIEKFTGQFYSDNMVWCNADRMIENFLRSNNNGFCLIGESGIGKTTLLKKTIKKFHDGKYFFWPVVAKQIRISDNFIKDAFGEEFTNLNSLLNINIMLEQRGQQIVFMVDAINEISATLSTIVSVYKDILKFCDLLSKENIRNIRLIMSCRSDMYFLIQNNINQPPSPGSFYCVVKNNGDSEPFYVMPQLTDMEIENMWKQHSTFNSYKADFLLERLGDVIRIPLYLDMICKMNENSNLQTLPPKYYLYGKWFDNILNTAKMECLSVTCIQDIIAYIIYYKYFSDEQEMITTSRLFVEIGTADDDVVKVYEWMIRHAIIAETTQSRNVIYFAHDKLEEFFLTKYMLDTYDGDLVKLSCNVKRIYCDSIVYTESLKAILFIQLLESELKYYNNLIRAINSGNEKVISVIEEMWIENSSDESHNLYTMLKYIEQYLCKSVFASFIKTILLKMIQKIDAYDGFDITVIENIDQYICNADIGNSLELLATDYYTYAKYIWTFPVIRDDRSYEFAIQLCEKIGKFDADKLPARLVDKSNQLLAILLRSKGRLNEAVCLMNKVFSNLYKNACYDDACQALLELGAMYRELTLFDKALELYESFDLDLLSKDIYRYRIYMNMGIIYKNKVQNALFEKTVNENTLSNYAVAKKYFGEVYNFAKENSQIPLLLEILAEQIECCVAGYYLDMATIADAILYAEEMDEILPKYAVPVRRIQRHRMWARILTLQGEPVKAIQNLREGFRIAVHYGIPFRAADCCNQISGIVCDNLNKPFLDANLLHEGITACQYSIEYYKQLGSNEHRYLNDTQIKLSILEKALQNLS